MITVLTMQAPEISGDCQTLTTQINMEFFADPRMSGVYLSAVARIIARSIQRERQGGESEYEQIEAVILQGFNEGMVRGDCGEKDSIKEI